MVSPFLQNKKNILVVGPAWIGDMVMTQSLFQTLRLQPETGTIDVLAPAWSAPLLQRMEHVDRVIETDLGHGDVALGRRWHLGRDLATTGYQQAIVIPRSFKAALIPWFARIPQRTGYRGEMRFGMINDMRTLDKSVLTQTVQRYVALGLPRGSPLPPAIPRPRLRVDFQHRDRVLDELALDLARPAVGIFPGAEYGPAKRWPAERFTDVVSALISQGYQAWIMGSRADMAVSAEILSALGSVAHVKNLCGKTSLVDAVDLISATELVVTNDSGLMHIAAAVDREIVAIYGSSSPEYTPPLTERSKIFYLGLTCSPCFERTCRFGHYHCLRDVDAPAVIKAIMTRTN